MKDLTLATLHEVDGLAEAFEELLRQAVLDCRQRPGMNKARAITLKVTVEPDKQDPDDVFIEFSVGGKMPSRAVPAHRMHTNSRGQAKFEPESPGNPDQRGLGFGDE